MVKGQSSFGNICFCTVNYGHVFFCLNVLFPQHHGLYTWFRYTSPKPVVPTEKKSPESRCEIQVLSYHRTDKADYLNTDK